MPKKSAPLPASFAAKSLAAMGLAALAFPASASGDVFWSVGVTPAPGVIVGATNLPPPVYAPPRVVYTPPAVVYAPPPMVYASPVYLVQPAPPWNRPHPGRGHAHGHAKRGGHDH